MKLYRALGTSDDVTTCDLCGRTDLKSTVAMALLDPDGNVVETVYFGSDCAARAAGWSVRDLRDVVKAADESAAEEARRARQAVSAAEDERWFAFLLAETGKDVVFEAIEALGGFAAARAAYSLL